jgi:hypothetical protein
MQASMQSIFKDLNARTSEEDFSMISTRSSYKDLCWFMQGSLRKFPQDHCKILSQGIVKEPPSSRSSLPGLHESSKTVIKGFAAAAEDLTRSWYKNLPRASQKSLDTSTSKTLHLQDLNARTS